jgi:hypothetical protein
MPAPRRRRRPGSRRATSTRRSSSRTSRASTPRSAACSACPARTSASSTSAAGSTSAGSRRPGSCSRTSSSGSRASRDQRAAGPRDHARPAAARDRAWLATTKLLLPYGNVPETIFHGMHTLLLEHNPPERRRLALARLARYAGEGGTPGARRRRGTLARARRRGRPPRAPRAPRSRRTSPTMPRSSAASRRCSRRRRSRASSRALDARGAARRLRDVRSAGGAAPRARGVPPAGRALPAALRDVGVDMELEELVGPRAGLLPRDPERDDALAPLVAREQGPAAGRLSRRAARAQGEAVRGRRDPPPLPVAHAGPRGDHRARAIVTLPARRRRSASPARARPPRSRRRTCSRRG